jgi:hypothetical protein
VEGEELERQLVGQESMCEGEKEEEEEAASSLSTSAMRLNEGRGIW